MEKESPTNEWNSASNPLDLEVGIVNNIPDIQSLDCDFLDLKAEKNLENEVQNPVTVEEVDDNAVEDKNGGK